jgi:hypothetical protein
MLAKVKDKVTVVFGERLDLKKGVVKDGTKIVKIVMESGASSKARCSSTPLMKAISWRKQA